MKKRGSFLRFESRKASTQVDWAMSLAIFLMYISWFFVIVRPALQDGAISAPLPEIIRENLEKNIYWNVERIPLYIKANFTANDYAVAADFDVDWENKEFAFSDNRYFTLDEGRLFFLTNISPGVNKAYIANSGKEYSVPKRISALGSGDNYSNAAGIKVIFDDGILDKIHFNDEIRVWDIYVTLNNAGLSSTDIRSKITPILSRRKAVHTGFNFSTYIFDKNNFVYNLIRLSDYYHANPPKIGLRALIPKHSAYYADNEFLGMLDFTNNLGDCYNTTGKFIDFYNAGGKSVAFFMGENSKIEFCLDDEDVMSVDIEMIVDKDSYFYIFPHVGDYKNVLRYHEGYSINFGALESIKGINEDKLNDFGKEGYDNIKKIFGYPARNEFAFSVKGIADYEPVKPSPLANVYVDETECVLIDELSNKRTCTLSVRTW